MTDPQLHFRPSDAYVGDVIPFEHDGTAWLYYLRDEREQLGEDGRRRHGMPWAAVTTTDFVTFQDQGIALPSGGRQAEDFDCYTGSVIADDDGRLHLFYTGHNPDRRTEAGDLQIVCHAVSDGDPASWVKHPEWSFGAVTGYAPEDWRDPFVFRPDKSGPWRMLLAARRTDGPDRRRGVVATLASDDLITWTPMAPLWDPRRFITQECPDVFPWGKWWYLVYSEFSDSFQTRYRIAETPDGPWHAPADDTVDGRAFYAAKTIEHNGRRYFVGWIASKEGESDGGSWQWAGTMSVLEAHQREDGSLGFDLPHDTARLYGEATDARDLLVPLDGADTQPGAGAHARYAAWLGPDLPANALVEAEFDIHPGTQACGLLLRNSPDADSGYALRMEPQRSRLVLDRWPRGRTGSEQWQILGDVPHAIELERPAALPPGRHGLTVRLEGDLCVVVLDGQVALSTRLYDHLTGRLGVFANDGGFELLRLELRQRESSPA